MRAVRPTPSSLPDITFPVVAAGRLDNGLTVLSVTDRRLPRVTVKLAVPAGRIANPDDNGSLVELTTELLKEGAGDRNAAETAAFMDRWALDYDNSVLMEQTVLSVSALSNHLGRSLEFLSDITRRPHLDDEELGRLKTRWHSQLIAQRASASFLASERLFVEYFGVSHPYRRVSFSPEELEAADREALAACSRRILLPAGALLLMAGDIDQDEAMGRASEFFGDWTGEVDGGPEPQPPEPPGRRIVLVQRPHSRQARLVIGLEGLPRADPDWHRLRLMNRVLGGGGSARLFLNLREDKGYTYGIYSYLRGYRSGGMLIVASDVGSAHVGESISEICAEMGRLAASEPEAGELERARSEIVGAMLRRLETPGSIGTLEVNRRQLGLPADYFDTLVSDLRAVTAAEVRETAARFLRPDDAVMVAVGDPDDLLPQLEPFGRVRVVDQSGRDGDGGSYD